MYFDCPYIFKHVSQYIHMKKVALIVLLVITGCIGQAEKPEKLTTEAKELIISSPAFEHNGNIPSRYGCEGENINPPLVIEGIPEGTVSLVLIVEDPDVPQGIFVHWVVFNINPETIIEENSIPGIEGTNNFRNNVYGGPCPPSGTHRYVFIVYALDTILGLDSTATKNDVIEAMEGHILARGELIGLYSKGQSHGFLLQPIV